MKNATQAQDMCSKQLLRTISGGEKMFGAWQKDEWKMFGVWENNEWRGRFDNVVHALIIEYSSWQWCFRGKRTRIRGWCFKSTLLDISVGIVHDRRNCVATRFVFEGSPSAFLCLYLRVFVSSLYMFFEVDTVFNFQFLRVLCFCSWHFGAI